MRYLLSLLVIGVMVYAIIDCVRTEDSRIRLGLPHWVWVALIVVLPGIGAVIWLVVSRFTRGGASAPSSWDAPRRSGPARPIAPDDDPDFLAGLNPAPRPVEPSPDEPGKHDPQANTETDPIDGPEK